MKKCVLNYHKNNLLLAAMVLIPIAGAAILLQILLYIASASSGVVNILIITTFIILTAFILYWIINKQIIIPCEITLTKNGFNFRLLKKSILYSTQDFFSTWENVAGISEVFCTFTGKYFYKIKFSNPEITANFSPQKNEEAEADCLFSAFDDYHIRFSKTQSKNQKDSAKIRLHS